MAPVADATIAAARGAGEWELSSQALLSNLEVAGQPLRNFLVRHGSQEERERFVALGKELRPPDSADEISESDLTVVVPAFVLTELKEAFVIAFMLFLPLLLLDMLVANVLLALGMQTLSPTQVSLPFKILLFVAIDGWGLLSRGLVLGYR
jgi:type III secretion protein R